MFRRRWEGLPKDVEFESGLKKLGFFVNEKDEIRSLENPEEYFQFRINRNDRVNERRGLHMNQAVENIVHERLEEAGLKKLLLPLDSDYKGPKKTPIFISKDLETKSRVVILVNDTDQDLGILAHRIAGGSGGINTGSMVSIVQALQKQSISAKDTSSPGIIITNAAQKLWDPEDKRAVTLRAHSKLKLPSLVHQGRQIDTRNWVPSNEDAFDHMDYVLSKVLPQYGKTNCRLDFIAIGIGADELEAYMDDTGWAKFGNQINTLTTLGGTVSTDKLSNPEYIKFRTQRARAWVTSDAPLGTPLANHLGNPKCTMTFVDHKVAAVYSAGVPFLIELILITAKEPILSWIQDVARVPKATNYTHPKVVVTYTEEQSTVEWDEPEPAPAVPSSGTEGQKKKSKKRKGKKTAKKALDPSDESNDLEDANDKSAVSKVIDKEHESAAEPAHSPTEATTCVDKTSKSGESAAVNAAAGPGKATAPVSGAISVSDNDIDRLISKDASLSKNGDEDGQFEDDRWVAWDTYLNSGKVYHSEDDFTDFTEVKRGRPAKKSGANAQPTLAAPGIRGETSRHRGNVGPATAKPPFSKYHGATKVPERKMSVGKPSSQVSRSRRQSTDSQTGNPVNPVTQSKIAPQKHKSAAGKSAAAGEPAEVKKPAGAVKPAIQRDPRVDNHEKGLSVLKRPMGSEDKETVVGNASKRLKENDRGTSAPHETTKTNAPPTAAPVKAPAAQALAAQAPVKTPPIEGTAEDLPAQAPVKAAPGQTPVQAPPITAPAEAPTVSDKVEVAPGQAAADKISKEAKGKQIATDIMSESGKITLIVSHNPKDTEANGEDKTPVDTQVNDKVDAQVNNNVETDVKPNREAKPRLNFFCEESDSESAELLSEVPTAASVAASVAHPGAIAPVATSPIVAAGDTALPTELKGSTETTDSDAAVESPTFGPLEADESAPDRPATPTPMISYSREETPELPLYHHGADAASVPSSELCGSSDSGDSDAAFSVVSAPPLLEHQAQDMPQTSAGVSVEMAGGADLGDSNGGKHTSVQPKGPASRGFTYFGPPEEGEEDCMADLTPEKRALLEEGMHRFMLTGSLIDPREVERLDAENENRKLGIEEKPDGTYNFV